jgi:hypothetical protein
LADGPNPSGIGTDEADALFGALAQTSLTGITPLLCLALVFAAILLVRAGGSPARERTATSSASHMHTGRAQVVPAKSFHHATRSRTGTDQVNEPGDARTTPMGRLPGPLALTPHVKARPGANSERGPP